MREPDLPGGIDYDRWTPLVKPAPREAFADSLDLVDHEEAGWVRLSVEGGNQRSALEYLADPDSWLGDPYEQTSVLLGHYTPYELARAALGRDA